MTRRKNILNAKKRATRVFGTGPMFNFNWKLNRWYRRRLKSNGKPFNRLMRMNWKQTDGVC